MDQFGKVQNKAGKGRCKSGALCSDIKADGEIEETSVQAVVMSSLDLGTVSV